MNNTIKSRKINKRKRRRQRQSHIRYLLMGAGSLALLALIVILVLFAANKNYIDFSVPDEETIVYEYGTDYNAVVKAYYRGTLLHKGGTEIPVKQEGEVDLKTFGTYNVSYTASYKDQTKTVSRTVIVEDKLAPDLKLVSDPNRFTSPGHEYEEEGYSAVDNYDGDLTDQVKVTQKGDIITYTVTDSNGNTATETREIIYKDATAPEIKLKGKKTVRIALDESYTDKGYTATDDCDGDLTDQVRVEGEVNTRELGDYVVTYSVQDSAGNTGTARRTVRVVDTVAPTLALKGDKTIYINVGEEYEDPGYTAEDNREGDITDQVTISGEPDVSKAGVYEVTYSVKDSSDNETTDTRTVFVFKEKTDVATTVDPGDKVVYLTFDDGPGPYTEKLLDVLKKYNVKATFFVTNQYPDYQDMIKRESEEGHTVAIHSYSHDYAKIYQSQEAFFEDMQKMSDICYAQTNERPTIIRFPGGSSNTISAHYCKGIMTDLAKSLEQLGYQYCDWNVSSGDAGETTKTDVVYKNVTNGMKNSRVSVVLQHDIKEFSVNAVEDIIKWGLDNGYTFLPLDETSPMSHHGINN